MAASSRTAIPLPTPLRSSPIPVQVGGHPGTVSPTSDGSFIIKAALPAERAFYEALGSSADPRVARLREWAPRFYGTLRLQEGLEGEGDGEFGRLAEALLGSSTGVDMGGEGKEPAQQAPAQASGSGTVGGTESLVLENICHTFRKPNILDVKLGTVLYDAATASAEKRERMERRARETTSGRTGVRLTGFQVYNRMDNTYVQYTKDYGRSLTPPQLASGLAAFFPCARAVGEIGLPPSLLALVLRGIEADVRELRDVIADVEVRMVGASVLVVYEGLEGALRAALERERERRAEEEEEERAREIESERDDPGGEVPGSEEEEEGEESASDPSSASSASRVGLPWAVRLIDFAHTRLVPGQGPDEGVLFGLRTLLGLLRRRREEVERMATVGAGGDDGAGVQLPGTNVSVEVL